MFCSKSIIRVPRQSGKIMENNTQENGVFTIFQPMLNELIVFIAVATTAPRLSSSHVPRPPSLVDHASSAGPSEGREVS
jgi:hypothetical protein